MRFKLTESNDLAPTLLTLTERDVHMDHLSAWPPEMTLHQFQI